MTSFEGQVPAKSKENTAHPLVKSLVLPKGNTR
jgi:hypothetical protein